MKHAREDYDRIQDPEGLIPEHEPVFLLRGQDKSAPAAVEAWAELHLAHGGSNALAVAARRQARAMREWQKVEAAKVADYPAHAVMHPDHGAVHPDCREINDLDQAIAALDRLKETGYLTGSIGGHELAPAAVEARVAHDRGSFADNLTALATVFTPKIGHQAMVEVIEVALTTARRAMTRL